MQWSINKQGATNINFSDGSWIKAVFPEILLWDKGNRKFSYGDLDVEVIEAKPGIENEDKHMDYKFVFLVNGKRIVLHAYNGKQRMTVCGQNYLEFVSKFLEPFFTKKIEDISSEATKFNEEVLAKLGKTVKRRNVSFKTSYPLSCKKCNQVAKSISQLHNHMKATHEDTCSTSNDLEIRHSTKNNSLATSFMVEDMSLSTLLDDSIEYSGQGTREIDMLDDVNLEEQVAIRSEEDQVITEKDEMASTTEKYKCDVWNKNDSGFLFPCTFKSNSADNLMDHLKINHADDKKTNAAKNQVKKNKTNVEVDVQKHETSEIEVITIKETEVIKHEETEVIKNEETEVIKHKETEVIKHEETEVIKHKETEEIKHEETVVLKHGETEVEKHVMVPKKQEDDIVEVEIFKCNACKVLFESNFALIRHISSEHKQEILEHICTKCRFISKTEAGMKRHESVFCDSCNICLEGKVDYDIHNEFHRICNLYKCEFRPKSNGEMINS